MRIIKSKPKLEKKEFLEKLDLKYLLQLKAVILQLRTTISAFLLQLDPVDTPEEEIEKITENINNILREDFNLLKKYLPLNFFDKVLVSDIRKKLPEKNSILVETHGFIGDLIQKKLIDEKLSPSNIKNL
jgi:hypothetical protein